MTAKISRSRSAKNHKKRCKIAISGLTPIFPPYSELSASHRVVAQVSTLCSSRFRGLYAGKSNYDKKASIPTNRCFYGIWHDCLPLVLPIKDVHHVCFNWHVENKPHMPHTFKTTLNLLYEFWYNWWCHNRALLNMNWLIHYNSTC